MVGVTVCVTADVEVVWSAGCGNGLWSAGCGNGLWSVGRPRGTCLCSAGCGRGDDAGSVGGGRSPVWVWQSSFSTCA